MDNPGDYQQVVQYKILKELKGRKRSLEPIPPDVMHQLLGLFKEGAVLDFEESTNSGVMIYPIGDILDTDEIHTRLDRRRSMLDGVSLEYNTRTKKWHTCVPFPY